MPRVELTDVLAKSAAQHVSQELKPGECTFYFMTEDGGAHFGSGVHYSWIVGKGPQTQKVQTGRCAQPIMESTELKYC